MGGPGLKHFLVEISAFCQAHTNNPALGEFIAPLAIVTKEWSDLTQEIAKRAKDNVEEIDLPAFLMADLPVESTAMMAAE